MAAIPYVTLATFQDDVGIASTSEDSRLERVIMDASRVVDRLCGRIDGEFAVQTMTRYHELSKEGTTLLLDTPLISVTTLKTDEDGDHTYEITWATTDYILYPLDGPPYTQIKVDRENGSYTFPATQKGIQVVGTWGDSSTVPSPIRRATILLANRYRQRANTPYGVDKTGERMIALKSDPDVIQILEGGGFIHRAVFV